MEGPRDPTLPKPNFRLRQLATRMQDSWTAFRLAKEYDHRREYLTHLRARIDSWLRFLLWWVHILPGIGSGDRLSCWYAGRWIGRG